MRAKNLGIERYRRVFFTGFVSAGSKLVQLFSALVTLPMVLRHLGAERYGLWMTIVGFISMMASADLGIGNGLLNAIARADGRNDQVRARQLVSNSIALLVVLALALGAVTATLLVTLDPASFLKIASPAARNEFQQALWVFLALFMVNLPLSVVEKIQLGYQEGYIESSWSGLGNLFSLFGIVASVKFGLGLPSLLLALYGAPTLVRVLNGAVLLGFRKPWLRPEMGDLHLALAIELMNLGLLFFVLQLAAAIVFTTDNLILSSQLGPASVASYAPAVRIFSLAPLLVGFFLNPLWPAYGEAFVRQDFDWIRQAFRRSMGGVLLVVVPFSLSLTIWGEGLLRLWLKYPVDLPHSLLSAMGLWTIMMTLGSTFAILFNSLHIFRFQVLTATFMSILSVIFRIVGVRMMGVSGIVWGGTVAYFFCTFVPSIYYAFRVVDRLGVSDADTPPLRQF